METHSALAAALAVAALTAALIAAPAMAEEDTPGAAEYRRSCLACHGAGARGDGPLAAIMTVPVPDLTQIAARREGTFPVQDVFMIIDGRTEIRGHGYPMPVWGTRYREEAGERYGPYGAERVVRARILELTYYLHGLQR